MVCFWAYSISPLHQILPKKLFQFVVTDYARSVVVEVGFGRYGELCTAALQLFQQGACSLVFFLLRNVG